MTTRSEFGGEPELTSVVIGEALPEASYRALLDSITQSGAFSFIEGPLLAYLDSGSYVSSLDGPGLMGSIFNWTLHDGRIPNSNPNSNPNSKHNPNPNHRYDPLSTES